MPRGPLVRKKKQRTEKVLYPALPPQQVQELWEDEEKASNQKAWQEGSSGLSSKRLNRVGTTETFFIDQPGAHGRKAGRKVLGRVRGDRADFGESSKNLTWFT